MAVFDCGEFGKYKSEVQEKWGQTKAYEEHREKTKSYSETEWDHLAEGLDKIMAEFAACMKSGRTSHSSEAQNLVQLLQTYITEHFYNCTSDILLGLGQMYVNDYRFKDNINKHGAGTAEYIYEAIKAYIK